MNNQNEEENPFTQIPEYKIGDTVTINPHNIDDLYSDIPRKYRLKRPLNLPEALSEFELKNHVETLGPFLDEVDVIDTPVISITINWDLETNLSLVIWTSIIKFS